ncbi:MAG: hypothetical protein Q8R88_00815 [Desulfoprunum sp.]|nr:hypothetical protein [Desulfoprunum sp.]
MADSYSIYGLKVQSQVALPVELFPSLQLSADVVVNLKGDYYPPAGVDDNRPFFFSVGPQEAFFYFRDLAVFTILKGSVINIALANGEIDTGLLANTLLGTPMGIVLLQRDFLVLHASAVEICGKVICFIGTSGVGKSTTVCSLLQAGHKLVTDDVVAIDLTNYLVSQGYPWMKIGPRVALELGLSSEKLSQLDRASIKKRYQIYPGSFSEGNGKLAGIYFLKWGEKTVVDVIKAKQAILDLMVHAYGFCPQKSYPAEEIKRFEQYAHLVKSVPCFNLVRSYDINQLNVLGRVIEEHTRRL